MKPITLSLFFPAYNEEANIAEAVTKAVEMAALSPFIAESEIIVVNDGSTDKTRAVVEKLTEMYPTVRLVDHKKNQGYGATLRSGFKAARMEYVFFTDADLQFDIVEVQNLLVHLASYDIVIGYRAPRRDPFMRLVNARVWNVLNRTLFGLRITDIDCAFKIFRRDLVDTDKLRSKGAMLSAELLIRLQRTGVRIKEVPVSHLPRTQGSPTGASLKVIRRAFSEMMRLYWGDLGLVTNKELFRFAGVGIINTAVDVMAYVLLTRGTLFFAMHLNSAKFLSFFFGTLTSLALNRAWTFRLKTRPTIAELARFYLTATLAVIINVGVMDIFLNLGVYDLIALGLATAITFTGNFVLSKFWVFRKTGTKPGSIVYQ